ncbi:MAG: M13 family metallopeptidase [Lachnospiraceae bacterium]|nr:M13 family metallopeptidase [Lachnospiraceae bacterium]
MCKKLCCVMLVLMILMTGCNAGNVNNIDEIKSTSGNSVEGDDTVPEDGGKTGEADETLTEGEGGSEDRQADTDGDINKDKDMTVAGVAGGGSPWTDSDIKENVLSSGKPDVKDDYNLAVNYEWLADTELREGYTYESPFAEMSKDTEERVRTLLEDDSVTGHDAELVHDFYDTILNWDKRDELGVKPVTDTVNDIMSITSIEEMSRFICDFDRSNCVDTFTGIGNNIDLNDPGKYIVSINNDTLLLEDPAEYTDFTDVGERAYNAKLKLFVMVAGRLGLGADAASEVFNSVLSLEEQIASASMTEADKLGTDYYDRMNNVYSEDEIKGLTHAFPLYDQIKGFGYSGAGEYVISEPAVIKKLDELYVQKNVGVMRNYMLVHYLLYMADKLDRECYEASVVRDNELSGAEGMPEDEAAAYNAVLRYINEPLEKAYFKKYDCTGAKKSITALCEEVIAAYREMLSGEDWLSTETADKAVEKLDAIRIKAVYPDKWQDYNALSLKGLDYVSCVKEINRYKAVLDRKHTGGRVDKGLWRNKALTANAYYEPQENSINIGAGILGDVFYDDDMSRAELLGGIGCIIGHEISHAFDETGSGFDGDGRLNNWWQESDRKAFAQRADRLSAYYDKITAFEGYKVIGKNVRSEAIADIAGMKVMLRLAEEDENFDYDAFFRQYAGVWKQISTYEREVYRLTRGEHPLNYLRVNAVIQQFDEFHDTYGTQEGDGMYLAPAERIMVW